MGHPIINDISMEKLRIVHPETNKFIGLCLDRDQAIASGAWCRSTNIFVLNNDGQVLCHKRSEKKERLPGVWSTHLGGHVNEQETYTSNAIKEVEEEVGIVVDASRLLPWRTSKLEKARLWIRDFLLVYDAPIHHFVPQKNEVDELQWMHAHEILSASEKDPKKWCAGTHDFRIEYECMQAVRTAMNNLIT